MNKGSFLRKLALNLVMCLAMLGLGACGARSPSVDDAGASGLQAPQNLQRTGRWFTDEQGRVMVMHGSNMINKLPPYSPDALGFGDKDLQFLSENGFNGLRIGMSWAGVEPNPGQYNDAYIDRMAALAKRAAQFGLLPVMNFHQDGYSEVYGGNGAPAWASISYGIPGTPLPPPANVLPGAAIANENFWANTAAPDGIGLQDHYAAAWQHVAQRMKSNTRLVYELFNEPSPGIIDVATCALPVGCPLFDTLKLAPMYQKVLHAVRQVDAARLIFVEPNAFFGLDSRTWLPSMNDPKVAFAFHDYCALALVPVPGVPPQPCDVLTSLTLSNAQSHFDATGETNLMNEFGAGDTNEVVAGLLDHADQSMLSWMHWAYWAQDFGQPATYGLINDLSEAPEGDNIKQDLLKILSRPSPRLIAGTPQSWSWDSSTATFSAAYSTARADGSGSFPVNAVSTFFVHPRFFPNGYQVQVNGGKVVSAANAPWLKIAAIYGANAITLTITPAGTH